MKENRMKLKLKGKGNIVLFDDIKENNKSKTEVRLSETPITESETPQEESPTL